MLENNKNEFGKLENSVCLLHVSEYKQEMMDKYNLKDFNTYMWYAGITSHEETERLIYIENQGITNSEDYLLTE